MKQALQNFDQIPAFAFTWATFLGAGLVLFLLRYRRQLASFSMRDAFKTCIPFDPLRSRSFHADLKVYIIRKLTDFIFLIPGIFVFGLVANGTAEGLTAAAGPHATPDSSFSLLVVAACILILAAEFNAFLWHYMEHKLPFLWELHKIHHSADHLNPLTNKRAHSFIQLGKFVMNGVISGVPAGLLIYFWGYGIVELIAISAIANKILTVVTLDALRHSHIRMGFGPLEWLIVSPYMHQVHHSSLEAHWDKNFGTNLAIFDWMFGTAYRPRRGEELTCGIYGYDAAQLDQFNTLKGTYLDPLARSYAILKQSLSTASKSAPRSLSG